MTLKRRVDRLEELAAVVRAAADPDPERDVYNARSLERLADAVQDMFARGQLVVNGAQVQAAEGDPKLEELASKLTAALERKRAAEEGDGDGPEA